MGKHMKSESSSPRHGYNHKSGWLAGMLHVFDFHRWRTKNRPICWKTPRTHSLMYETNEQEPFLDSKNGDSQILSVAVENPTRQSTKMMTTKQVTEYVDFLEILRKEDVSVKILKDPNSEFKKQVHIKSSPRKFSDHVPAQKNRPARDPHPRRDRIRPDLRAARSQDASSPRSSHPRPDCIRSVPSLSKGGPVLNPLQTKAEVNYLGQFSHGHLVKLIGYCLEDEHRLLVYEFMPRGSLENHLFRRGLYFQPLSWKLRLKVALGAAKGLAFLHSSETRVIYRDFKTSNILLDSEYNAKLSDFGLAKDGPIGDESHVSTRVMGTHGYAAPEYLATGHLTTKSDVYSFGVVLLELLSGRRAMDRNRPSGERNLVEWAKPYLANKRKIFRVVDNRLQDQYSMEEACKVATLSLRCLTTEIKLRPDMKEVVSQLEHIQSLNASRGGNVDRTERRVRRRSDSVVTKKPDAGFVRQTAVGCTVVAYPRPSASPLYV
ncbi:hypothetical protein F2Q70_00019577 [Brassica cretica]|uniref:Protein kinase domain-containing protein n=1 Tax=Brassica cretica TaxID=69181 RepID=A0A8S9GT29_BRACR|nr:hypothetical protein F2Q70_00019577 [Brassica cretica]